MKIIILLLSFSSIAMAKECKYALEDKVSFLNKNIGAIREVPMGKCSLVKKDIFIASGYSCEASYNLLAKNSTRFQSKYPCYQPAIETVRGNDHGVPFTSMSAICYICRPQKH